MASNYEKEPIFVLERAWDDKTKMPEKYKFQGTAGKAEVHISSGALGMEFFLEKTLPQFNQAGTRLDWTWGESFSEFENVLADRYKTTWLEVLHDHFPEPLEAETIVTAPERNREVKSNFYLAIDLFIKKVLDNQKPRDLQYIYMAPGGDHVVKKDLLTPPRAHSHRFKEMLRIAKLLSAGEIAKPTESLAAEWYYMTYHKADRDKFVASGKKLADETIESLTEYFQALFAQKKSDGTLEKQEMDRLRNHARKRVAEDLRHKIRVSESSCKPYLARREEDRRRARDDRRSYYDRRDERDRTSRATSSRGRDDDGGRRGPSHARGRKPSGSSRKRDGGEPCSFHSPPGAPPARHTWEQCSENPRNSKARAEPRDGERRRDTAYMADPRYRSSDDERSTGSDGDTVPRRESDHSDGEVDGDDDNYAVNISVPKRRKLPCQKKRPSKPKNHKVVASEDEGPEDTFLANHDPLDMDSE